MGAPPQHEVFTSPIPRHTVLLAPGQARHLFHPAAWARDYYQTWWDAFSTTAHPEHVYFTDHDFAVAEVRFQGTHTGSFLGVPPTGRQVDLPTAIFVTFRDGLMAGERMYWDMTTLLRQPGEPVFPPTR